MKKKPASATPSTRSVRARAGASRRSKAGASAPAKAAAGAKQRAAKKSARKPAERPAEAPEAGAGPPGPPSAGPPARTPPTPPTPPTPEPVEATSLSTRAARNLTTVTKSVPQTQGLTPRWLLRMLPWVDVSGGVYRVNRRLCHTLGDGAISFTQVGEDWRVIPSELGELAPLRGLEDLEVLEALADRFVQREHLAGSVLAHEGRPVDALILIARGKVERARLGKYGDRLDLGPLAEGDHLGAVALVDPAARWPFTVAAAADCTVLALPRAALAELLDEAPGLRAHLAAFAERIQRPQDKDGQAAIELAAGHAGEPELPRTFVAYERFPREYELSVAQTILHVHTRVADLFNGPMDQVREQVRLTSLALRERQEHELLNDPEFGLLHSVDARQRIHTRRGPPTPDDLDELLSRRRKTGLLLAHPRAIAAFGRECSRRGVYAEPIVLDGRPVTAWRGVPLLPCPKIPVSDAGTTSILALRLGEENQGVVGLRPAGLPEQVEPGLNVRFMGIDERAVLRYLISAYHSVAVLVPDALGVLDNVELGR